MKQCRIVLRRVAVADEAKVFCNLLGRKLLNSSDNDDEGILGTPAMVSRPLDFRTIDLRLAVGAYGGSHEAFLEDVRELWTNVHIAYGDQPDFVQLAETLSRNFELLYEKEVVGLFQKFVQYAKSECLSAASKKEINDFLVSANELPKAPWEEGVCKVCGIDKDDDSVLLCDTCDAEYHTYCLNPPLARIPEGNWYCPSCVAGKHMVQDAKECTSIICQHQKKNQGEVTRVYLDALAHLAAIMEEREYWEFNVDERTFLLNFLCDELLNSALIRQHLEQCAEVSVDLQQELRSISVEWRNLKNKEETFAAKVMVDRCSRTVIGDVGIGEGPAALTNNGKCSEQSLTLNSRPNSIVALSDDVPSLEGGKKINDLNRENSFQGDAQINVGRDISTLPSSDDLQGLPLPLDKVSTHTGERLPPMVVNGSAESVEFNSVRNEISLLQDSISSIEMRLLKLSMRREFLGSDSAGRSYWILARPGCSGASCSFVHELKNANPSCSPWVSYQSDAEIKELMGCLKDSNPKERELKKSIFHWQKLRFQESLQSGNQDQDEHEKDSSNSTINENSVSSKGLVTRAASLLEGKYGPCFEPETIDLFEKRGKKAKVTIEEKMYRCECLEPVWPSRNHCFSCHRTFFTDAELEGHHDANCNSVPPVFEKNKGNSALKGKSVMKFETTGEEFKGEMGTIEAEKNGCSELRSSLIIYQNDRLVCPYDFEDICSKFLTKNSNKELVQEIGLIGSNGIPSFVPSVSPYLSDPTLMLLPPQKDVGVPGDDPKSGEQLVFSQGNKMVIDAGQDSITDNSPRTHAPYELSEALKTEKPAFRHLEQKEKKSSFPTSAPVLEAGNCCIVPESSLRPLVGKGSQILRRLKINLLDMDAALPEAAVRPSKKHLERRWAWRAFVKSAETIYEMVQAIIIFEDMIRTEYLRNMWWYWSSLSAAAKISTLSSLALRIYSLDAAIDYENNSFNLYPLEPSSNKPDKKPQPGSNATEKSKLSRKPNKKRKEPEG
ncbi:hypothetical protein F0562_004652 [Nyssa sinensis]|uniref:PHD-type domain-containing protein n=1 Tax=Nyssa sinensis TaxID=561372 RepID=A0A5J5C2G2_9ASTE|nr:hypothetical protein F0562_004652 [Nyssa sinensis]